MKNELIKEAQQEQAYKRKQQTIASGGTFKSDELKKRVVKLSVPTLPPPTRDVPKDFQRLLDEFNISAGEEIIAYYNPIAVPKISSTLNMDGTYSILGREGRWELWRKVPATLPAEAFERCQPCIIQELGTYTRLWTIMDNQRHINVSKTDLRGQTHTQIATTGDYREPDERDIKQLRWCDTSRTPEGAASVMEEIYGKYNERKQSEAEADFEDLVDRIASYYWNLPRTIVPVGGGGKNQKADWRTPAGLT